MIKYSLYFLTLTIALLTACTSDDNETNGSLIGEWKYTERAYSIGAGLILEEIEEDISYSIMEDGTFTFDNGNTSQGTWSVNEEEVLSFEFEDELIGDRIVDFSYDVNGDVLTLTPAYVICTEGCYDRFVRQ